MNKEELLNDVIFFKPNRVWRCYTGGLLLDEFTGTTGGADGNFPEDWLASITRADNDEYQQSPDEGLSQLRDADIFFSDLLKGYPREALASDNPDLGVLCKFLDSAVRLPIQCHPDRDFARIHFNSEHGKTESWLILATREINGEKPYILFGFKPGVDEKQFRTAVEKQDIPAMCDCLNKVEVNLGDMFFIPGRLPHALGPGLMLLEVQEPTDLVIQPEQRIGDVMLSEKQMWNGLDHDTAFSCFDYTTAPLAELMDKLRIEPFAVQKWDSGKLERIIGPERTDCFRVDRLTIEPGGCIDFEHDAPWYLGIVCAGNGSIIGQEHQQLHCGDRFFVSNQISRLKYECTGESSMQLYIVTAVH